MKPIVPLALVAAVLCITSCRLAVIPTPPHSATSSSTPTLIATLAPIDPPSATQTPQPPMPEPSATAAEELSGQVWTAANAASAQPAELLLPDYPVGLYWPDSTKVLVYLDSSFLEIYLDPLMTGVTIPVRAPGTILGISPDGSGLIYQGGDGGLFLWERSTQISQVIPYGGAAYFATYSPDGQTIAIGAVDTLKVTLYDSVTMQPFQTLTGFETAAPVYSAIPGPNRGVLAWFARGQMQFQDISSSALGGEMGYQDFIIGISFSPIGDKTAVTVGGLLQVINTTVNGDVVAQDLLVTSPGLPVTSAVFSPDGGLVAAGVGSDVVIWETTQWTQVAVLPHGSTVRLVSFSPDGRGLVSVNDVNLLLSWRLP